MKQHNTRINTSLCILALVAVALVTASLVVAEPTPPSSLSITSATNRNLSQQSPQTIGAQGGNVTEVNIVALTITTSWQGYYGNLSGVVTLQDATNSTFYNWSMTSFNGQVYATRASSIPWNTVNCTNSTNRTNEETFLGQVAGDSDSVTNTFNRTTHPAFNVGTNQVINNTCFSTNGYVNNNSQNANFSMVLLSPPSGVIIYAAVTNRSVLGFDGRQHDFELLVGENEKTGNIGATTYYFWTQFG